MRRLKDLLEKKYSPTAGNTSLLIMVLFSIFIIPLFPMVVHRVLYNISYTVIFFMAIFSVESKRSIILWIAIIATITEWMAAYLDLIYLVEISYAVNVFFFALVVSRLIYAIVRSKVVTARVIIEAINCYLLIGLIFGLLVTFMVSVDQDAFNFTWLNQPGIHHVSHISQYLYYTFVTFTTLGYGDIVPQTPAARSLAIFIGITGQIYIAIIMALLVGKFASTQQEKK